jgi:hypothetical protein
MDAGATSRAGGTDVEERHRQYKGFWDLTRMHSCVFSLVVNHRLFVLLGYTLDKLRRIEREAYSLLEDAWPP